MSNLEGAEVGISRDATIANLLFACYRALSGKGMTSMFLDGVSFGDEVLVSLGKLQITRIYHHIETFQFSTNLIYATTAFRKWAEYGPVWREI